ncbi:hypothetical protein [Halomarina oriensis]|uniref:Uncharacterized protein n=1 Tax=Halomarina oriensis TaxID=671145 RepID=A0A6B0GXL6_9EURY|nr:hypothetical protein [Halomarina oriensis]MWG36518.1 hypothetical protein [Halomarina oriensis]
MTSYARCEWMRRKYPAVTDDCTAEEAADVRSFLTFLVCEVGGTPDRRAGLDLDDICSALGVTKSRGKWLVRFAHVAPCDPVHVEPTNREGCIAEVYVDG